MLSPDRGCRICGPPKQGVWGIREGLPSTGGGGKPAKDWATINLPLYTKLFTAQSRRKNSCHYCCSWDHTSTQCPWGADVAHAFLMVTTVACSHTPKKGEPPTICISWNRAPVGFYCPATLSTSAQTATALTTVQGIAHLVYPAVCTRKSVLILKGSVGLVWRNQPLTVEAKPGSTSRAICLLARSYFRFW